MKVLLLGGTGAMGGHLANILFERGFKVVITTRSLNKSNKLFEYRQGNAKEIGFLRGLLLERWDAIIDFMVYSDDEFQERIDFLLSSTSQYESTNQDLIH